MDDCLIDFNRVDDIIRHLDINHTIKLKWWHKIKNDLLSVRSGYLSNIEVTIFSSSWNNPDSIVMYWSNPIIDRYHKHTKTNFPGLIGDSTMIRAFLHIFFRSFHDIQSLICKGMCVFLPSLSCKKNKSKTNLTKNVLDNKLFTIWLTFKETETSCEWYHLPFPFYI